MKRTGLGRGIGALFEQNGANNFIFNDEDNKDIKDINEKENVEIKEQEIIIKPKEELVNKEVKEKDKKIKQDNNKTDLYKEIKIDEGQIVDLKLIDVVPNDKQARKIFNENKLEELANSIKMFGVLQPIIVEPNGDYYTIVAGERRWRASKLAGQKTIPAIISKKNDSKNAQISIIENLQREDLNPVEKARGFNNLMKEYNLTGKEVSELTGINFSSIFNSLKILNLNNELLDEMQNMPNLSEQACLALLETDNLDLQREALILITEKGLSATEALKRLKLSSKKGNKIQTNSYLFTDLENKFEEYFGNKVKIKLSNAKKNSGKIIINYSSQEDLERMMGLLD